MPDALGGQYPGKTRFLTERLGNQQVAPYVESVGTDGLYEIVEEYTT